MATNKTPMGVDLEMPKAPPLRKFAIHDSNQPCLNHQTAYSGTMPCTGRIRCHTCGGTWDEQGKWLGVCPDANRN